MRYKSFPYPVLDEYGDAYINCSFKTTRTVEKDGFNLKVHFHSEITDDVLAQLITTGKALLLYHLECAQTGYRIIRTTSKWDYDIVIDGEKVNGEIEICSFIVSNEEGLSFYSHNFNSDYQGQAVKGISKGCILGVASVPNIRVFKSLIDLVNSSSPFRIRKNQDPSILETQVEFETYHYIRILLNEEAYNQYGSMNGNIALKPVMISMLLVPALTYVLTKIKYGEIGECSDRAWYKAIKESLKANFNIEIDELSDSDKDPFELAQKMLKIPITDAMKNLVYIGVQNVSGEEDDE